MKTTCRCNFCGHKMTGNSGWRTEMAMWDHVTTAHPNEVRKFRDGRKAIREKMENLRISLSSLYSTKQGEKVFQGGYIT